MSARTLLRGSGAQIGVHGRSCVVVCIMRTALTPLRETVAQFGIHKRSSVGMAHDVEWTAREDEEERGRDALR